MDEWLLLARLVHILAGVFWVGAMVFVVVFLFPAVRELGPDGGKVVAGIARRRFMVVLPVVAVLSILSGLWLYWKISVGFSAAFMKSSMGITYGIGGTAAIVALIVGITMVRPAMVKSGAIFAKLATAAPEDRQALLASVAPIQRRAIAAERVVAMLLISAAIAMAIARYV